MAARRLIEGHFYYKLAVVGLKGDSKTWAAYDMSDLVLWAGDYGRGACLEGDALGLQAAPCVTADHVGELPHRVLHFVVYFSDRHAE